MKLKIRDVIKMNTKLKLPEFKTKTEIVYDFLKQNILEGHYLPKDKIVISDISKQLNVSDIPIREAIERLQVEGYVDFKPHIGARVIKIDKDEFIQLAMVRGELEALAARIAVDHLSKENIAELKKINKEGDNLIKNKKFKELMELNKKFHFKIYNSIPHKFILKMISDLWDRAMMLPNMFVYSINRCKQSQIKHKLILEALKKGDGTTASEIIKKAKIDACNDLFDSIEDKENNENFRAFL